MGKWSLGLSILLFIGYGCREIPKSNFSSENYPSKSEIELESTDEIVSIFREDSLEEKVSETLEKSLPSEDRASSRHHHEGSHH